LQLMQLSALMNSITGYAACSASFSLSVLT
jgi:hypothetical protein